MPDFLTSIIIIIVGLGSLFGAGFWFYKYVKHSNGKYKKREEKNKGKLQKKQLSEQEVQAKIEAKIREKITEEEKNRKEIEKYKIEVFEGWTSSVFIWMLVILFIAGAISLIIERDFQSRYETYQVLLWIYIGMLIFFSIGSAVSSGREQRLSLKPDEQREKYEYNEHYIYTDSIFEAIIYTLYKIVARVSSVAVVVVGGYLLLSGLGTTIEEMDLKTIVIIGIIIIVGLLIMIFSKLNSKDQ